MACTWIDDEDVAAWLRLDDYETGDDPVLVAATAAANEFAYRRRQAAGYTDEEDEAPNAAAALGATIYAGTLYREAGSVDQFASYEQMGSAPVGGGLGQIMRLLGVNRPRVA